MWMKALSRWPGRVLLQHLADLVLEPIELGHVSPLNARPQDLRPAEIGKGADTACLELEPTANANNALQRRLNPADVRDQQVAKEMQREMDTFDRIWAKKVGERRQPVDWRLESVSNVSRQVKGDEDAPALLVTVGRGCQRSP